ncbi:Microtubule bundling protein [Tilletia horrida]|nr:Microtubule bundling protein [Tilletia horrida]
MDIPALTALLSTSTSSLAALHTELGHPPEKLQQALALLADTVRSTVDAQIASVRAEVDNTNRECEALKARADGLRTALGDEPFMAPTKTARKKSSEKGNSTETLLSRKGRLEKEAAQLEETYNTRKQQIDTLLEHIQHFAPVLDGGSTADMSSDNIAPESDAEDPAVPPLPEREIVVLPIANADTAAQSIPAATNAYIQGLTAHLNGLHALQQARAERFQAYLQHIFDLWGTLHVRPQIETDVFERSICRAAGVKPVITADTIQVEDEETGEVVVKERVGFRGQFEEMGEEEELLEGEETPLLLPSVATLRKLRTLVEGLSLEKRRREERIQTLYDELFVLWSRFDCDESEMDEFVLENKGLALESIAAYESELAKMTALKAQHSLTFIKCIRDQMTQYSASARLAQAECEALFPEFFIPLPDAAHAESDQPQPAYDGLLAAHEAAIPRILALLEAKAPIMRLVERYEEVCKEEDELAESAKNTARLFAGGKKAPGTAAGGAKVEKPKRDPGRLLREEKMRKRVKVLKPKLESEMLKAIPAWEQENGEAFMLDGERYLDKLEALVAARKPATSIPPVSSTNALAGQKRGRQGSVGPSPAPTPSGSRVSSMVLATPLGPSSAHNRAVSSSAIGSAMSRGKGVAPPQTPSLAPAAKKARLASATNAATRAPGSRIAAPTPAGAGRSGAGLGSSISSTLARTPAALQASKKATLAAGVTAALNVPKRPAAASSSSMLQQQQQQAPAITLLPLSAPFRPRPSVGGPFNESYATQTHEPSVHQRVTSGTSNTSMATSNAGTVIIHAVPQRSLFSYGNDEAERNVTAPLFFGGGAAGSGAKKVVAVSTSLVGGDASAGGLATAGGSSESEAVPKSRGNRSRPSLSLQKTLLTPAEDVAVGGGSTSSSSMRLVSTEIARRLGVAVAAGGAGGPTGNWDRLMVEEEDDLEEEDLVMASVAEEEQEAAEQNDSGMALTGLDEVQMGVRRSARVAATAH